MAFLHIKNVVIKGLAACVPAEIEENDSIPTINTQDLQKLIKNTGIERRRIADKDICTSDLCYKAAEKLIVELGWAKEEIEGLIFVTQTPDYILPSTSPLIQDRLGLSTDCFTLDISLGCSGYIFGLSTLAGYMQNGSIKKALLLVGDTISRTAATTDKSTYPLFGDAGTATALEFVEGEDGFKFHLASDGLGYRSIIINDGGYRNQFSDRSLAPEFVEDGITRSRSQLTLDGMDVFSFGISKAPESVNAILNRYGLSKDAVDLFFFHQANMMMNERIRKKLQLPEDKVPYSLKNFGNTSGATIPLTMVTESAEKLTNGESMILSCGFGVGLSWGSFLCTTENLVIPQLVVYE